MVKNGNKLREDVGVKFDAGAEFNGDLKLNLRENKSFQSDVKMPEEKQSKLCC